MLSKLNTMSLAILSSVVLLAPAVSSLILEDGVVSYHLKTGGF